MGTHNEMTDRQRKLACLRYQEIDRVPVVHFGFWRETLAKWADEGHLSRELAAAWGDGNEADREISAILGFDSNWSCCFGGVTGIFPRFDGVTVATFPDGSRHVRNGEGVTLLERPEAGSIPSEIAHLLKDRVSWEEHYKWRYAWSPERINKDRLQKMVDSRPEDREQMLGLFCGSLIGSIRNILGIEGLSYLAVDDEELFDEIITANADTCYNLVKYVLEAGFRPDFAHFWEDICYKNGPLVSPRVFREKIAGHYRRITDLLHAYDVDIISVDCDGWIDALLPVWLENGVNTMFPIEVGTWNASIAPWREKYGRDVLGVGGVNKTVLAKDQDAVDAEVERVLTLARLGGFIPCLDHRIPPDAKWDLVRYYCERMRAVEL